MNIKEKDCSYIANTYSRFPLVLTDGKGSRVKDENGKEYIDMSTGIAVNTFGYSDNEWISAVTEQLSKIQHASNLYFTEPAANLAEQLIIRTGMKKVFFSNSGAEANECAIKVARKYAAEKKGTDYYKIITLNNSFHGRTITTLAATGQEVFHKDFLPLTDGFIYVDANNIVELKKAVSDNKIAAIMFEIVQGEGGVLPLEKGFIESIKKICAEQDILTIVDEVQCGNGRSGKLYAYMHYGLEPDIVSTAKGLAGGLPLGATLLGDKTADVLKFGDHGSTFGGNPVCCAAALNVLNRLDDKLLEDVSKKSEYIFSELSGAKGVKSVSGLGLMIGIETEKAAADVINACMEMGVLVIKAKSKIRLLPALNIPFEDLKVAIEVIKKACL